MMQYSPLFFIVRLNSVLGERKKIMSMNVWVKCGKTYNLLDSKTTTGAGTAIFKDSPLATFQVSGSVTASTGAAVVLIQFSNDNTNWITGGTVTLTLGTSTTTDGFTTNAPWKYVRANVQSISGTNASVSAVMGV